MAVDYERRGPVAVVTIDRPERKNAVDAATAGALADARERFAAGDADVMVLTGAGADFSAGADLKAFDLEDRPEGYLGLTRTRVEKPTIAAVEGYCVAGGLELALWCDIRVAGAGATFGCLERRFGVPLVDGGTQRLPRVVGLGRALDMIVTGREVDAALAAEWGLVTRVVEAGGALAAAVDLGERVASFPQATLRSDLAAVYDGVGEPLSTGLELEAARGAEVLDTAAAGAERFAAGEGRGGSWPPEQGEEDGADDRFPEGPDGGA